jgi:hypothetical protein
LFALVAFNGKTFVEALLAFAVHLIPSAIAGLIVLAGWRWPWLGAAGFAGLAFWYAASVRAQPGWLAAVAGPLILTAILFALSAMSNRRTAKGRPIRARESSLRSR